MFSLRFGANRHFNVRVSYYMFLFWFIVINDYFFYCAAHCGSSIDG